MKTRSTFCVEIEGGERFNPISLISIAGAVVPYAILYFMRTS